MVKKELIFKDESDITKFELFKEKVDFGLSLFFIFLFLALVIYIYLQS